MGKNLYEDGSNPPPYTEDDKLHPIYSDQKNISSDSLDTIDSGLTEQFGTKPIKSYFINRVSKSAHYNKLLLDENQKPVFFVEHHDFRSPYIQLRRGDNKEAPSVAQMKSNMWLTKFDMKVPEASGAESQLKNQSKLKHNYTWSPPGSSDTFAWKSTGKDSIQGKSKFYRANFKMVNVETDEVVAMVVWGQGLHWYKMGSFILSQPHIDQYGEEWEYMTLMGGLALLHIQLQTMMNASAASSSASNAAVIASVV